MLYQHHYQTVSLLTSVILQPSPDWVMLLHFSVIYSPARETRFSGAAPRCGRHLGCCWRWHWGSDPSWRLPRPTHRQKHPAPRDCLCHSLQRTKNMHNWVIIQLHLGSMVAINGDTHWSIKTSAKPKTSAEPSDFDGLTLSLSPHV